MRALVVCAIKQQDNGNFLSSRLYFALQHLPGGLAWQGKPNRIASLRDRGLPQGAMLIGGGETY